MTKRRLNDPSWHEKSSKKPKPNPFLCQIEEENEDVHSRDDALLTHTVEFLELEKKAVNQKSELTRKRLLESLQYLLTFLESTNDELSSQASVLRTATILLPWVTKKLVESSLRTSSGEGEDELLWRSFAATLKVLMTLSGESHDNHFQLKQNTINQALPNKLLVKLVPHAAHIGLSDEKAGAHAKICYDLLVEGYFVPSLDVALKSLFFKILDDLQVDHKNESFVGPIIMATLRVLEESIKKANPKTVFQSLSTEDSLLAFARAYFYFQDLSEKSDTGQECQDSIRTILSDSLFHPEHHLDGFRSIVQLRGFPTFIRESREEKEVQDDAKIPSTFHCYQENLLNSLQILGDNQKLLQNKRILAARLMPLLLQGFLEQLSDFDKSKKHGTKKRGGAKFDLAQMQFFFFATAIVPLWDCASREESDDKIDFRVRCLRAINLCLKLLLKHDAFVPSDGQKLIKRQELLETLTTEILERTWHDADASEQTLAILETLVRLDHRLAHERLETAIGFCVKHYRFGGAKESHPACTLMTTLIKAYHQLRQFNRVFSAILRVLSTAPCKDASVLGTLLSQASIKLAFANAIKENPSHEVKEMFLALDDWIKEAVASKQDHERISGALAVAVQHMGVGLLGNVRVDKSTASDIAGYCRTLMKNSVQVLSGEARTTAEKVSQHFNLGVTLCAWIINLQMRCVFWLGYQYIQQSEIESPMPHSIRQILISISNSIEEEETGNVPAAADIEPILDELMLLASFRLRQLDYLVHEQSGGDSEELSLREEHKEEARRLALLMVRWANGSTGESSRWQYVAQVVTSWVPYAEEQSLRSFLVWMFRALADPGDDKNEGMKAHPGEKRSCRFIYERERTVALSLLKDASFIEIDELSELFAPCVLATVALLVQEATASLSKNTPVLSEEATKRKLCPIKHHGWVSSSSDEFAELLEWVNLDQVKGGKVLDSTASLLKGALRLMKVFNGLPTQHSTSVAVDCGDSAARLESFCRQFWDIRQDGFLIFDLISTLRVAAAKELAIAETDGFKLLPKDKSGIVDLLVNTRKTTVHLIDLLDESGSEQKRRFLSSTEQLMMAIAACYLASSNGAAAFIEAFEFLVPSMIAQQEHHNETELIVYCVQLKAVLDAIYSQGASSHKMNVTPDLLSELFRGVVTVKDSPIFATSTLLRFHGCLLGGSLLRTSSRALVNGTLAMSEMIEGLVASVLPLLYPKNGSRSDLFAALYVVSCYAMTRPPFDKRLEILDTLLELDCENPLLDASIGSLVRDMENDYLRSAVSKIYLKIKAESNLGLRLCRVLIRNVRGERQLPILSGFAKGILQRSAEAFASSRTAEPDELDNRVTTASSVVTELIQDKRLISVKERDIALILALTCKVLGHSNQNNQVFASCFSLAAALMQRFPKQLYSCAPSLIAMLHQFQRHVLYDDLDNIILRDRTQKFTRLCELLLLHKEVYKKHVICLLLEFVHCLEHEMSLFRKECLFPSTFYLLDILSKYEMQQLNSLMDTTAKTLFRSVHQSYQKLHAYKGQ